MSNHLRVAAFGLGIVAAVGVLSGCTAGAIVSPDGSPLTGYNGPSSITFKGAGGVQYTVATTPSNGALTFSFDPYAAGSATNGPYIPPGNYELDVTLCTDATHCTVFGNWEGFTVAYNNTCTDSTTGNSVPCALFKVVRCNFPADYWKYGTLCTGSSVSGNVTTVGVLDGP